MPQSDMANRRPQSGITAPKNIVLKFKLPEV